MIEHATHVEAGGVMACIACLNDIAGVGMRVRCRVLPRDRHPIGRGTLAIVTARLAAGARHNDLWIGMIWKRRTKCYRRVTVIAFHRNARMSRLTGVGVSTNRGSAVVAR